jgi:DUF971 family protein
METIRPTGVTADRNEKVLIIKWSDGHVSRLPFAGLRAICPCVECKGGHDNMGGPPDLEVLQNARDESINLEQVEAVGSYALQFHWSDGHWTGIYTWAFLRQADPVLQFGMGE